MNVINKIIRGDKVIWIVALLLGIVSLIVVYSASSALAVNNYGGKTGRVLLKHGGTLLIGFIMMFVFYSINYKHYAKAAWLLLIPCLALLVYTMLFGQDLNQANRTIKLSFLSFQPSELAKIILITYLARQLYMMGDRLNSFREVVIWLGIPMLLTAGLIAPENLSTAAILIVVCLVLLFIGRVKFLHILSILGIGMVLFGIYIGVEAIRVNRKNKHAQELVAEGKTAEYKEKKTRVATWSNRLEAIFGPKEADYDPFDEHHYQQTYAKIAVATSSGFGKGPGKSEQRNFLPHPYSDFIYAIIVEEYGIFGALFVLMLYIILFTRVLRIMLKRPLTFGAYLSFGLGFLVIVQAMINMGVSIGLLPVTGQPLPFVSMGGTSLMATGIILGMILSVTRNIEEETPEAATITDENQQLNSNTEGVSHEE